MVTDLFARVVHTLCGLADESRLALPLGVVYRHVTVDEVVVVPLGADPPRLFEDVGKKRRGHRPHPEVQPTGPPETAHRRVDHREPGLPALPRLHEVGVVILLVEPLEHRVDRCVGPSGPVDQFLVVVEIPDQPVGEHLQPPAVRGPLGDRLVHLPHGEQAEVEIRRETAGPVAGVLRCGDALRVRADALDKRVQSLGCCLVCPRRYLRLLGCDPERLVDHRRGNRGVDCEPCQVPTPPVRGLLCAVEPRRDLVPPVGPGPLRSPDESVTGDKLDGPLTGLPDPVVPALSVPAGRCRHRQHGPATVDEPREQRHRVAVSDCQPRRVGPGERPLRGVRSPRAEESCLRQLVPGVRCLFGDCPARHRCVQSVETRDRLVEESKPGITREPALPVETRVEDEQRTDNVTVGNCPRQRQVVVGSEMFTMPDNVPGGVVTGADRLRCRYLRREWARRFLGTDVATVICVRHRCVRTRGSGRLNSASGSSGVTVRTHPGRRGRPEETPVLYNTGTNVTVYHGFDTACVS